MYISMWKRQIVRKIVLVKTTYFVFWKKSKYYNSVVIASTIFPILVFVFGGKLIKAMYVALSY